MDKLQVLCIDDQAEVGAAVSKDLQGLSDHVDLINCDSALDANAVLDQLDSRGEYIALIICDQVMPVKNGVDFMAEIKQEERFKFTQTILLTGQATHQDTIRAINEVHVDAYISKPWDNEILTQVVKQSLARYVLRSGLDYLDYMPVIDQAVLYRELRRI
jgi:two-component system, chemotaxis family, chemotaxis protein CheY